MTTKGLIAWQLSRALAVAGAFKFLPARATAPDEVTRLLSLHEVEYTSLAIAKANHPSRFLVLILEESSICTGVAKVALDERGTAALTREADALRTAKTSLTGTVGTPVLQKAADGLLVLDPVAWQPRAGAWRLPAEVAYAMGTYSRVEAPSQHDAARAHGDFAPWNLLRTRTGWVVIDWEHASAAKPPFFDLWHYLVQAHALLGHPSSHALIDGLEGKQGWVRTAIVEFARGTGRASEEASAFFDDYIAASAKQLAGKSAKEQHGLRIRAELQQRITGTYPQSG